ncbi:MAG: cation-transporting P-type ATPase, partial [Candidatus Paceibacteria bacterium]
MQYQGLSQQEAEKLQKTHGLNQITKKRSFSLLKQLWNVVKEPTFSLLIG